MGRMCGEDVLRVESCVYEQSRIGLSVYIESLGL